MKRRPLSPRERRILKAVALGLPPVDLARRFRTTPQAMSTALTRLRRLGHDVPSFSRSVRGQAKNVRLDHVTLKLLSGEAKRVGMTSREAAAALIRLVVAAGAVRDMLRRAAEEKGDAAP